MTLFDIDETLEVSQLIQRVSRALQREFPKEVWVRGQIRNLNPDRRRDAHVFFNLATPTEGGASPDHLVKVVLFASKKRAINARLQSAGAALRMEDGMEVRVRASVQAYGRSSQFQLVMSTIDPDYTIGRLAADREALVQRLLAEGLLDHNAQLPIPLVPLRVALVTSAKSAAEADFLGHLDASPYAFSVTTFDAQVQGLTAPESLSRAILLASKSGADMICLTRGGGSRTDLSGFDAELVARAIAQSSTPVIAGIGHEIDRSVADLAAAVSVKTPTACAEWLIDRVATVDAEFVGLSRRISVAAQRVPVRCRHDVEALSGRVATSARRASFRADAQLDRLIQRVVSGSRLGLARSQQRADHLGEAILRRAHTQTREANAMVTHRLDQLERSAPRVINEHRRRVAALEQRVHDLDPQRLLRRGWSITVDTDGRPVMSISDIDAGAILTTRLFDGTITSEVTDVIATPDLSGTTRSLADE